MQDNLFCKTFLEKLYEAVDDYKSCQYEASFDILRICAEDTLKQFGLTDNTDWTNCKVVHSFLLKTIPDGVLVEQIYETCSKYYRFHFVKDLIQKSIAESNLITF